FHNGHKLPRKGKNYHILKKGMVLQFQPVKVVDRGWYHCRVGYGSLGAFESSRALLTVLAKAEIINKVQLSRPREEYVGSVIHLSCKVAGIPPPVVEWRRNGNL
ncbi:unnamed protein product, partial [Candidula unifasciata]